MYQGWREDWDKRLVVFEGVQGTGRAVKNCPLTASYCQYTT